MVERMIAMGRVPGYELGELVIPSDLDRLLVVTPGQLAPVSDDVAEQLDDTRRVIRELEVRLPLGAEERATLEEARKTYSELRCAAITAVKEARAAGDDPTELEQLPGIGHAYAARLAEAGINTVAALLDPDSFDTVAAIVPERLLAPAMAAAQKEVE